MPGFGLNMLTGENPYPGKLEFAGGVVNKWNTTMPGGNGSPGGAVDTRIYTSDNSIVGPAIDHKHKAVYFLATSGSKLALKRYNWEGAGTLTTVRETPKAEDFPAKGGATDPLFALAVDEVNERVYWFVKPGASGKDSDGVDYSSTYYTLFSLSVKQGDDSTKFRMEAAFEYVIGGNLGGSGRLKVDCLGNVFLNYFYDTYDSAAHTGTEQRIVKFVWNGATSRITVPAAGTLVKSTDTSPDYDVPLPWSEISPGGEGVPSGRCEAVGGDCHVHAFTVDITGELHYVYKAANGDGSRAKPRINQIRRRGLTGADDVVVYSNVYYEYEYLGQTIHALEVDLVHRMYYVTACFQNCMSLEIIKLPMGVKGGSSFLDENKFGCLWGHSTLCRFQGMGEEVVFGGKEAIDQSYSRTIGVKNLAANFANGHMWRGGFKRNGIAVTPAHTARQLVGGALCAKPEGCVADKTTPGTCKAELPTSALSDTRKLYFTHDQGDLTARKWRLNEVSGAAQPKNCGSGSFWNGPDKGTTTQCYPDPSDGTNSFTTKTIAYGGFFFGRSIVGPAIDPNTKWMYFIWCSAWRGSAFGQCNGYTLSRYCYETNDKCLHGETQDVYSAPRQLFPAPYPSAHYEGSFTMTIDPHPDRLRVYWYAAHQNVMISLNTVAD